MDAGVPRIREGKNVQYLSSVFSRTHGSGQDDPLGRRNRPPPRRRRVRALSGGNHRATPRHPDGRGSVPRLRWWAHRVERLYPGRLCVRDHDNAALVSRPSPSPVGRLDGATGTGGAPRRANHPFRSTAAVGGWDPEDARGESRTPDPRGTGPMDDREHADAHLAERGCGRLELLPRGRTEHDRRVPGWLELRDRRGGGPRAHAALPHPGWRASVRSDGSHGRWDWNCPPGGPLATRPTARSPPGLVPACVCDIPQRERITSARSTTGELPGARPRRRGTGRIPRRRPPSAVE